jgi:hypothetical protein
MSDDHDKGPAGLRPGTALPATMTADEAATELAALAASIAFHDQRYHGDDAPVITDADYDALVARNRELEAAFPALVRTDSPSLRVGAPAAAGFGKIRHARPMLSLNNGFTDEDIIDFGTRIRRFLSLGEDDELAFTAEPKIDGLSLSLRYEKGRLFRPQRAAMVPKVKMSPRMFAACLPFPPPLPAPRLTFLRCGASCIWTGRISSPSTQRKNRLTARFLPIRAMRRQGRCGKRMPA